MNEEEKNENGLEKSLEKNLEKKIGKILATSFIIGMASIVTLLAVPDLSVTLTIILILTFILSVVLGCIYTLKAVVKTSKNFTNQLKETKPKLRFRYNDTFYYHEQYNSSTNKGAHVAFNAFHILEDIKTNKLYGFNSRSTNIYVSYTNLLGKVKVKIYGNNNQPININDEGNMWIDEENQDFYSKANNAIFINEDMVYSNDENKINGAFKLLNINPLNNINTLDKVTFVSGYAEIDKK